MKLFVLNKAKRSSEAFQVGAETMFVYMYVFVYAYVHKCARRIELGFVQVKTCHEDGFHLSILGSQKIQ